MLHPLESIISMLYVPAHNPVFTESFGLFPPPVQI